MCEWKGIKAIAFSSFGYVFITSIYMRKNIHYPYKSHRIPELSFTGFDWVTLYHVAATEPTTVTRGNIFF